MLAGHAEPSMGELLGGLARDTGVLVRQEVQLAKSEMASKTSAAAREGRLVAAGGALVHAGVLALMTTLIVALAQAVPLWLSALIVGVVIGGGGALLLQRGLKALKRLGPLPEQTIQTLKEDLARAKEEWR